MHFFAVPPSQGFDLVPRAYVPGFYERRCADHHGEVVVVVDALMSPWCIQHGPTAHLMAEARLRVRAFLRFCHAAEFAR